MNTSRLLFGLTLLILISSITTAFASDKPLKLLDKRKYQSKNALVKYSHPILPSFTSVQSVNAQFANSEVEPNNDVDNAQSLARDTVLSGVSSDMDMFAINVTESYIEINLEFLAVNADLELDLYDAAGELVAFSDSTTDNESILYETTSFGTYYVLVYTYNDAYVSASYELSWTDATDQVNADDNYEVNNDWASAYVLDENLTIQGVLQDEDWFALDVVNDAIEIQVTFDNSVTDVDIYLYDSDFFLVDSSASSENFELINLENTTAGRYYLRVVAYDDEYSIADYALTWSDTSSAKEFDDFFESNNSIEDAYNLIENVEYSAKLLDVDWYKMSLDENNLEVEVSFADAIINIDIEVYDANGNRLAIANSDADLEVVSLSGLTAGDYFLRVFTNDEYAPNEVFNDDGDYDVLWREVSNDSEDDIYEENDDSGSAYLLNEGTLISAVAKDEDWYEIEVSAERVLVDLTYSDVSVGLNVALFDSNLEQVESLTGLGIEKSIDVTVATLGTYYIRITSMFGYENTPYQLIWDDEAAIDLGDDLYEPNNVFGDATFLNNNIFINAISADEDWYKINVTDGVLEFDMAFSHNVLNLDVALYNENEEQIAESTSENDGESFTYPVSTGTYYIRVYRPDASATVGIYQMSWFIDSSVVLVDDSFEPNDTLAESTSLVEEEKAMAVAINPDWYEINVTGDEIQIVLTPATLTDGFTISLFDSAGNLLTTANTVGTEHVMEYDTTTTGQHYIEVRPLVDTVLGGTYELSWVNVSVDSGSPSKTPSTPSGSDSGGSSGGSMGYLLLVVAVLVRVRRPL